jgi:UDPglucose--hexose-1-phosphate uridylyltransferase
MSEFRQDIVSGDWAIIAPGRAKRPDQLVGKKPVRKMTSKRTCPFEFGNLCASGQWPPIFPGIVTEKTEIIVIPNKYPALALAHADACAQDGMHGLYHTKTGVGEHELVITRDHTKTFADLAPRTAGDVFEIFQERHRALRKDPCIAYISTFFNWGSWAGASVWHPHYQILGIPIVPPHIAHSLKGSEAYFKEHRRCVRCDVIRSELKEKTRVIAKNADAIAFVPFASKHPFEMSIFPLKHVPSFGHTPAPVVRSVAQLLQKVLGSLKRNLHDPDYNVFVHSAPLNYQKYPHHHWHVEILPKTTISAGFEFATDININIVAPEDAAKILRK